MLHAPILSFQHNHDIIQFTTSTHDLQPKLTKEIPNMKNFLLSSKHIEKDSFIWNMIGSMLVAFQSVIILMVLTRTVGIVEAGIFTLAFASANLLMTIGKYGIRFFQVSDVKNEYDFSEYLTARYISTTIMIAISIIYVLYVGQTYQYTTNKSLIIIWMCLFKSLDAIEDVYCGLYQKAGRLDVASKVMSLRVIVAILTYCVLTAVLRDQLLALIITTISSAIFLILLLRWTYPPFKTENIQPKKRIRKLLFVGTPLFIGMFLPMYIGNAPKYAIDALLSDEIQAHYGFIAMPVFVIGLLNGFIFNPMIYKISVMWNNREMKKFRKSILQQAAIIFGITVVCIIGAYFLGIPVLSILYNTDLSPYKTDLLILLLGGGFFGLSGFLNTVLTIIRFQNSLAVGYGIVALFALFFSNQIVSGHGVAGASILYLVLMLLLSIFFTLFLMIGIKKYK